MGTNNMMRMHDKINRLLSQKKHVKVDNTMQCQMTTITLRTMRCQVHSKKDTDRNRPERTRQSERQSERQRERVGEVEV
jgi:hypothetical protein